MIKGFGRSGKAGLELTEEVGAKCIPTPFKVEERNQWE